MTRHTRARPPRSRRAPRHRRARAHAAAAAPGSTSRPAPADAGELTSSDDALTLLIGTERRRRDGCRHRGGRRVVGGVRRRGRGEGGHRPAPGALAGVRGGRPARPLLPRAGGARGIRGQRLAQGLRRPAREQGRLLPLARGELHVRGRVLLRPEGLLDARPRHQQGTVGCRGPHRRRHPHDVGRADRPSPRRSRRTGSSASAFGWEWQRIGHVHGAGRRRSRRGRRGDREQPGERRRASTYVKDQHDGRHVRVRAGRRRRLGRRGVRQAADRHDDRGQLDHRAR